MTRAEGACGACGGWGFNEFFEVGGSVAVDALVGEEADLEFNPGGDGEPVKGVEYGCDVVVFPHSHQDPGSTVLDVLQSLDAFARGPDEKCVAVVKP